VGPLADRVCSSCIRPSWLSHLSCILGIWKVPFALILFLPGLQRLKEWAYAGGRVQLHWRGSLPFSCRSSRPGFHHDARNHRSRFLRSDSQLPHGLCIHQHAACQRHRRPSAAPMATIFGSAFLWPLDEENKAKEASSAAPRGPCAFSPCATSAKCRCFYYPGDHDFAHRCYVFVVRPNVYLSVHQLR